MKQLINWFRVNGNTIIVDCIWVAFATFLFKTSATERQSFEALSIHTVEVLLLTALVSFVTLYSLTIIAEIFRANQLSKAKVTRVATSKLVKSLINLGRFLLIAIIYNFLNVVPETDTDAQGVVAILILCTFFFMLGIGAYHQYNKELNKQANV